MVQLKVILITERCHYIITTYAYTAYIVRLMNLQCVQDRTDQRPVQMSYEIFQGGFKKTIKYKTQKKSRNQTKWKQQQQQKNIHQNYYIDEEYVVFMQTFEQTQVGLIKIDFY